MKFAKFTVFAAGVCALAALSCREQEILPSQDWSKSGPQDGPLTMIAVADRLSTGSKAEMAYSYDVLWQPEDKILVESDGVSGTFVITGGEGTPEGTFAQQDQSLRFTGSVKAYYPASLKAAGALLWPATQSVDEVVPMLCEKTIGNPDDGRFDFKALGTVLQIVFSTPSKDVVLKSVSISDSQKTMSGEFRISGAQAQITASDKAGITLDYGEKGLAVSLAGKEINLMVPSAEYKDVTLVLTSKDGRECRLNSKDLPALTPASVARIYLAGEFNEDTPTPPTPPVVEDADAVLTFSELPSTYKGAYGKLYSYSNDFGIWSLSVYTDGTEDTGMQINSGKIAYIGTPTFQSAITEVVVTLAQSYTGEILVCSRPGSTTISSDYILAAQSGSQSIEITIDVSSLGINQFYLRSTACARISALTVRFSGGGSSEGAGAFGAIKTPGIYDLSDPENPASVFTASDEAQTVCVTTSSFRSWTLVDLKNASWLTFTFASKTAVKGISAKLTSTSFGTADPGVNETVTVVAKSGNLLWLEDTVNSKGYIINIE